MAKEMLLVDPSVIETMQINQPPALTSHNITRRVIQEADDSIKSALSDNMLTPSEQVLYYNQALQKREQYVDKPTTLPEKVHKIHDGNNDQVEEEIIDSVPHSFRNKAALLVKKWKRAGVLGWNKEGNLVYKGEHIPGTNIVDIVNDVIRNRAKNPKPKGWDLVAQGIKDTNVPLELVGNQQRYNEAVVARKNDEFHTPPVTPKQLSLQTPAKKMASPQKRFSQRMIAKEPNTLNNTWLAKQ